MAPEEWQHTLLSYEALSNVSIHAMTPQLNVDPGIEYPTNMGPNTIDLGEPVLLKDKVIIPAFTSQIAHVQTQKTFMKGYCLNVMVQPLYLEEKGKTTRGALHPVSLHRNERWKSEHIHGATQWYWETYAPCSWMAGGPHSSSQPSTRLIGLTGAGS